MGYSFPYLGAKDLSVGFLTFAENEKESNIKNTDINDLCVLLTQII
jgi:hypothetical protein